MLILELHGSQHILPVILVVEHEIENTHAIDRIKAVVPFAAPRLFADRKGGVKHRAILEKILFRLLHLHHEALPGSRLAGQIEHRLPSFEDLAQPVGRLERKRDNLMVRR